MSVLTLDTGLSPSLAGFPKAVLLSFPLTYAVQTPQRTRHGLGSSGFARRYSRNRCFFLFLRLLRCFSSPGSLPYVMDWRTDTQVFPVWVSPFRNLRIHGHVLLPAAYRSLSRLSSALSAKASTLCPFCLATWFFSISKMNESTNHCHKTLCIFLHFHTVHRYLYDLHYFNYNLLDCWFVFGCLD